MGTAAPLSGTCPSSCSALHSLMWPLPWRKLFGRGGGRLTRGKNASQAVSSKLVHAQVMSSRCAMSDEVTWLISPSSGWRQGLTQQAACTGNLIWGNMQRTWGRSSGKMLRTPLFPEGKARSRTATTSPASSEGAYVTPGPHRPPEACLQTVIPHVFCSAFI